MPHFNALAGGDPLPISNDILLKLDSLAYMPAAESIAVYLTTFSYAPESSRIRLEVRAITPFKVIRGHRVWYQSKAYTRLPISD